MSSKADTFTTAVLQQSWDEALQVFDNSPLLVRDHFDRAILRLVILAKQEQWGLALAEADLALQIRVQNQFALHARAALRIKLLSKNEGHLRAARAATKALANDPALATEMSDLAAAELAQAPFGLKKVKRMLRLRAARRKAGLGARELAQAYIYPWDRGHFRALRSLRDYASTHGKVISLGPGDTISISSPIGEDGVEPDSILVKGYPAEVRVLRDVTVCGNSSILLGSDCTALSDPMTDERYGAQVIAPGDEILVVRCGGVVLAEAKAPHKRIDAAVWLAGHASNHFGHWFAEFLPKLRHLVQIDGFEALPILVDAGMPEAHYRFLSLLVSNETIVIERGETVEVGTLYTAPTVTFFPFDLVAGHGVPPEHQAAWSADALRFIRDRVLSAVPPAKKPFRRVYMSRRNSSWRHLLNEQTIIDLVTEKGFEVVLPETLTFEQQVQLFQETAVLIAPNGSLLNSLIFADPSVRVLVFMQEGHFNWGGWLGPIRELGFDPKFVFGRAIGDRTQKHGDYEMPLESFLLAFNRLVEDRVCY